MASIDVDIEKIVAGGVGLGRHEGRVVFVPATAPGERHRVEVVEERKDYLRGQSVACLEAAATRRPAPCSYYQRCGGCALMHLEPDSQLAAKKSILLESLARGGGFEPDSIEVLTISSPEEGYRTRVRFHVSRRDDELVMGFRRRSSRVVEDIEHCRLAGSQLNARWRSIRRFFHADPTRARGLESVELQESTHARGRIVGRFLVRSRDGFKRFNRAVCDALLEASGLDGVLVGSPTRERSAGETSVHHRIGELTLRQSAGAFFQTNRFLVERLVALVVPERVVARVVDLYCGVGLFSLPLARVADDVVGVEASPVAVGDAVANAKAARTGRAQFIRADAARFVRGFRFTETDYVVVDPPRGGLPKSLQDAIASSPIRRICYVSCDPAAFGRDAGALRRSGFRLERVDLLDFFPNTHHFETVAQLSRSPLDSGPRDG